MSEINILKWIKEQYETDFTESELAQLEPRDKSIYEKVTQQLEEKQEREQTRQNNEWCPTCGRWWPND